MNYFSIFLVLIIQISQPLSAANYDWDMATEHHHGTQEIKVYRSPTCNCCHKWINHLEKHEFNVIDMITPDMASIKDAVKLPKQLASCHTAIIDGYIIEGHVPADDIKRLLMNKPDIAGLSVPQMPVGTPGMEMGERKDDFVVLSFSKDGNISIFNQYQYTGPQESISSESNHKH